MLLDTSGLYCLLDAGDKFHAQLLSLMGSASIRLTHNYVLAEFVALCNARRFRADIALGFVSALAKSADISVFWVQPVDHEAALNLLRTRLDKNYSLSDAVSFLLMRSYGITEALTTDRHFQQEGFTRLLNDP
jgi:predicted nucleic acid-binding protein